VTSSTIPNGATRATGDLVEHLMKLAFDRPREPRSDAYKNGVRAVLAFRANSTFDISAPYAAGSAERDAFIAGMDEGREVWRSQMRTEEA